MGGLEFAIGTRVRLLRDFGGLRSGSEGAVIGFYRTEPATYAVTFGGKSIPIPPEHLVAVETDAE